MIEISICPPVNWSILTFTVHKGAFKDDGTFLHDVDYVIVPTMRERIVS